LIHVFAGGHETRGDHRFETAETGETLLIESSVTRASIVIEGGGGSSSSGQRCGRPVESIGGLIRGFVPRGLPAHRYLKPVRPAPTSLSDHPANKPSHPRP
jgi:hypothetical protein